MQSGIMFESITGGYILAGYHEVIYTQACKDKVEEVKREMEQSGNKRVLWRIFDDRSVAPAWSLKADAHNAAEAEALKQ